MNERLQISKYLRIVSVDNGVAIYHSLRGGLCMVDKDASRLLKVFQTPRTIGEIAPTFVSQLPESQIPLLVGIFKLKGFLVSPDYDEYNMVRKRTRMIRSALHQGSQIGVIQLVVTNHCNYKCRYCFINDIYITEKRRMLQVSPTNKCMSPLMARQAIENVIRIIRENQKDTLTLQFFGGEPLLNWDTIKFVLKYFGNGGKLGIRINYSIVTNGSLINTEMADYFLKYDAPVIISLDLSHPVKQLNTSIKTATNRIKRILALLKKNGNKVVFNTVLSKETFDFFEVAIVDFALEYDVYEIGVLLDLDLEFYKQKSCSEIVDKLMAVYCYGKSKGVMVTGYWHTIFQRMTNNNNFQHNSYKTCSATGCQLSIEPSGDTFACKASSGSFGHILEIKNLLSSNTYKEYALRTFRNARECAGCEIEGFCSGVCLGAIEKKYNTIHTIEKNACKVFKKLVKSLIVVNQNDNIENYRFLTNNKPSVNC